MGKIVDTAHDAIARVAQLGDRAHRIFTEFDPSRIIGLAREAETRVAASTSPLPLAGLLISVKDLYDEAGITTTAASRLLSDRPPATTDAEVITRIKRAGAVPFGRTTLSEFAYSGVGLNPHYGTPGNLFDESRIPGGSTSGGALTVALNIVDAALGTDTGGSIRIPAAVNGLIGFKPSHDAVPTDGIHPLAPSFDTAGPLARDLATVVRIFEVIAGQSAPTGFPGPARKLRLVLPENAFTNDLHPSIQTEFDRLCDVLTSAGHALIPLDLGFLMEAAPLNRILVAAEALRIYGEDLEQLEKVGDPRVLKRLRYGETLSEADVAQAYSRRDEVIAHFNRQMSGFDALVAPTLMIPAPTIAEAEADFDPINAMMLRNTGLLNLADACAISLPAAGQGKTPAALMLGLPSGSDWQLLSVAHEVMSLLPPLRR